MHDDYIKPNNSSVEITKLCEIDLRLSDFNHKRLWITNNWGSWKSSTTTRFKTITITANFSVVCIGICYRIELKYSECGKFLTTSKVVTEMKNYDSVAFCVELFNCGPCLVVVSLWHTKFHNQNGSSSLFLCTVLLYVPMQRLLRLLRPFLFLLNELIYIHLWKNFVFVILRKFARRQKCLLEFRVFFFFGCGRKSQKFFNENLNEKHAEILWGPVCEYELYVSMIMLSTGLRQNPFYKYI